MSAGAAGLAASGLFGGLEPVKAPEVPPAEVGKVIEGQPWNVTVVRSRLVSELPSFRLEKPDNRWFAVIATVEVTAPESRNDFRDVLTVSGVTGLTSEEPDSIVMLRDSSRVAYLNPNMPETLAYIWEQDGSAPLPTNVEVTVFQKTYRVNSLDGHMFWTDDAPRAQLQVPVEDRRAS
ncbi:hypothetical protein WEI85_34285 [Actinomycetes bacterium KLBMP 9797]